MRALAVILLMFSMPSSERSRGAAARVTPRLSAELDEAGLRLGAPIFIRIFKESRELELWVEGPERFEKFRSYPVCTYSGGLGPKLREGDRMSPEGFYFVNAGRMNPNSRFHLSFNLGYPNAYDRHHGRTGSALMVHGDCVSIGCYAMTDRKIEEIYTIAEAALAAGQPFFRVHVFPFRTSERNLERHRESEWIEFWRNLAEGNAHFERAGRPPDVGVRDGRYTFSDDGEGRIEGAEGGS